MDWDIDEQFEAAEPKAERTYETLPEGKYLFTIKGGAEKADRTEIRLAPEDRRFGFVFCRLVRGQDWAKKLAAELRTALGMTAAEWAEATPETMQGRKVRARVYHATKNGSTFVNVGNFLPLEEEAAAPAPAAAAAKAERATRARPAGPEDDIPF
jgi:hypothetical protein